MVVLAGSGGFAFVSALDGGGAGEPSLDRLGLHLGPMLTEHLGRSSAVGVSEASVREVSVVPVGGANGSDARSVDESDGGSFCGSDVAGMGGGTSVVVGGNES